MNYFNVDINLPEEFDEEFTSHIPEHRTKINELMKKGIITAYSLSDDLTKVWATFKAESETEVEMIMRSLPLHSYFEYEIYSLRFHNSISIQLPVMSLN